MSSNLTVQGLTALSNAATFFGVTSTSNAAFMSSNLTVQGLTALSNDATFFGVTSTSNAAFFSSNLTVQGLTALSNDATFFGVTSTSNAAFFSSNLTVVGLTTLSNHTTVFGDFTASNNALFTSNVTILGSLNATTVNFQYSNVTVYQSEDIRSNLYVQGTLDAFDTVRVYDRVELSNVAGVSVLATAGDFLGVNQPSPAFTLDVNGDINFSGKIYQQGAIFSGWNSNAAGNYINSNAAFKGEATATDVLLLYTTADNLAFSFSNPSGKASMWSAGERVGLMAAAPLSTLDVGGDVRATLGVFAHSNAADGAQALYAALRAPAAGTTVVAAGFSGDAIATGAVWSESLFADGVGMMSRLSLVGSAAGVHSNARTYAGATQVGAAFDQAALPVLHMDPLLFLPTGDTVTSNVFTTGSVMVAGSTYIEGSLQANQAHARKLKLTLGANTFSNALLGAVDAVPDYVIADNAAHEFVYNRAQLVLDGTVGDAGFCNCFLTNSMMVENDVITNGAVVANSSLFRTLVLQGPQTTGYDLHSAANNNQVAWMPPKAALASAVLDNANLSGDLALTLYGHAAFVGDVGVQNEMYVGGTVFVGANMQVAAPLLPHALAPGFSAVHLVVDGDVVVDSNAYVHRSLLVNSNIGVGTQEPAFPIDVQINVNGISLNCAAKVTASEFSVYSDQRIKKDIVAADVDAQLAAILRLQVSEFAYVDAADKGAGTKTGFIAQQVASVLPACVTPVAEFLPNVMAALPIAERTDRTHVALDLSALPDAARALLLREGAQVKCRAADGGVVIGRATAADAERRRLELEVNRVLDEGEAELFVVGTKVDDFHVLNYEQISTIAIGALQAQQKRIDALEALLLPQHA
jgi:hypothetical protein